MAVWRWQFGAVIEAFFHAQCQILRADLMADLAQDLYEDSL